MDGVSIAASIVGIASAGVQIAIKLVTLATQISTASERVSSIGNDMSLTSGVLHQLGELMTQKTTDDGISIFSKRRFGNHEDIGGNVREDFPGSRERDSEGHNQTASSNMSAQREFMRAIVALQQAQQDQRTLKGSKQCDRTKANPGDISGQTNSSSTARSLGSDAETDPSTAIIISQSTTLPPPPKPCARMKFKTLESNSPNQEPRIPGLPTYSEANRSRELNLQGMNPSMNRSIATIQTSNFPPVTTNNNMPWPSGSGTEQSPFRERAPSNSSNAPDSEINLELHFFLLKPIVRDFFDKIELTWIRQFESPWLSMSRDSEEEDISIRRSERERDRPRRREVEEDIIIRRKPSRSRDYEEEAIVIKTDERARPMGSMNMSFESGTLSDPRPLISYESQAQPSFGISPIEHKKHSYQDEAPLPTPKRSTGVELFRARVTSRTAHSNKKSKKASTGDVQRVKAPIFEPSALPSRPATDKPGRPSFEVTPGSLEGALDETSENDLIDLLSSEKLKLRKRGTIKRDLLTRSLK
ncbi:hypothetical protein OEA41_010544 [Lepraria neglecta]|uniref:Fungal N-terminal domain-containing protein n=1 Tax=Lepraria neglecta TaxID=209136 RepID=A0AAD9YZA6_9LECA|nr:hypothetical protein OEA41_010544 [Lepraria neglecta]